MFDTIIYMIRNGDFGSNFESKLFIGILALVVSLYIWKKYKNKDYLVVFLIGTIFWAAWEFYIQFVGIREFNPVTLFGMSIPLIVVAILRGAAEGGFVAFIGLLIGDLIINKATRVKGTILLLISTGVIAYVTLINSLPAKIIGGAVASRRNIFEPTSVLGLLFITIASFYWLTTVKKEVRERTIVLVLVMIIISGVWTITQVVCNMRWIEMLSNGVLIEAPLLISFLALAYDVVFEIGVAYIPFFAIPYALGLLKGSQTIVTTKKSNKSVKKKVKANRRTIKKSKSRN